MKGRPLLLRYLMYHHGVCGVGGCVGVCVFPGGRERERALCAVPRPRLRLGGPAWSPTAGKKKEKRRKRESCALCHVRALPPFFSPHILSPRRCRPHPRRAVARAHPPRDYPLNWGFANSVRGQRQVRRLQSKRRPTLTPPRRERVADRRLARARSLSAAPDPSPHPPPSTAHRPGSWKMESGSYLRRRLQRAATSPQPAAPSPPRANVRRAPLSSSTAHGRCVTPPEKKKKTPHTARLGCPSSPLQDVRALARRRPGGRGRDDGGAQPARPAGVGLAAGKEGGRHMGGARFSLPFSCRPPSSSPLPSLPPPSPGRLPPGPDGRPRPPGSDGASR